MSRDDSVLAEFESPVKRKRVIKSKHNKNIGFAGS